MVVLIVEVFILDLVVAIVNKVEVPNYLSHNFKC